MSNEKLLKDYFRWDEDEWSWVCVKCGEGVGSGVSLYYDVVEGFDWRGSRKDSFTLEAKEGEASNQKLECSCGVVIPAELYRIEEDGVITVRQCGEKNGTA